MTTSSKFLKSAAMLSILGLTLAACGDDNGNGNGNGNGDENGDTVGDGETITLGYVDGWTDGLSSSLMWQVILEDQGYEVEIEPLTDAAPLYAGLADGSIDVYPSSWLPVTHEAYMDEHGDDLEDLGDYYQGAVLTLTVPGYTDVDSIDELPDNADLFDGEVIGIEPGAGHMETTSGIVFPEYGLDDEFELVESSTAAMMAELDNALDAEEDIVVTLWRPFWAYDGERDLKDLEDPEGHLGEEETLNLVAHGEFSSEHPEVADWMSSLELTDDEYAELEDLVVNQHDGDIAGAEEWVENNSDIVDELLNN